MATRKRKKKQASPRPQPITFVDAFAGIGGFHLALTQAGAILAWACDFDADAADTYRRNFNHDPTGDMFKLHDVDSKAYRQLGNSVAVPVVRTVAKNLIDALRHNDGGRGNRRSQG